MTGDRSLLILGCGYVGSAVAKAAQKAGWRVGAVTRNAERAAELRRLGLDVVAEASLDSTSWLAEVGSPWRAVLYAVSASDRSPGGYRQAYVDGQAALEGHLAAWGTQQYLYTGSTGIYPQSAGEWVTEDGAASPGGPGHAGILAEAEAVAARLGNLAGAWQVLRLAGIYGPGRTYLLDLLRQTGGTLPGSGDYFVNWIHQGDIASAALACLQRPAPALSGAYNVSDGAPTLRAEVAAWLAEKIGLPGVRFDPQQPGGRSGFRQGAGGTPPNRRIDHRRLCETFGWRPRFPDFRAGYADLLGG